MVAAPDRWQCGDARERLWLEANVLTGFSLTILNDQFGRIGGRANVRKLP